MAYFPQIAATAESLDVFSDGCALIEQRDDVIQNKIVRDSAIGARIILPVSLLVCGELRAFYSKLRWFVVAMVGTAHSGIKHLIKVFGPQFLRCKTNTFPGFFGMFVAKGVFVAESLSFSGVRHLAFSFFGVLSSIKGVVLSYLVLPKAGFGAKSRIGMLHVVRATIERSTASLTLIIIAISFVLTHVMPPLNNGVNSVNNSTVAYGEGGVNTEPSLKRNLLEGATTRGRGYVHADMPVIAPTNAPAEKRDIVWTAWRHAENIG